MEQNVSDRARDLVNIKCERLEYVANTLNSKCFSWSVLNFHVLILLELYSH